MSYQWSLRDITLLNAHLKYHQDMGAYLHQLQQEGPELCEEMPKKPRGNISSLLNSEKQPSTKLSGQELHEYLLANMAAEVSNSQLKWEPTDLNKIKDTLVLGYQALQQAHSNTFATAIDYGYFLNKAFDYFTFLKDTGKMQPGLTFQHWLKDNVGISDSYARKLRSIAITFFGYGRFRKLGISFEEFYKRREEIRVMLSLEKDIASFWSADS